MEIRTNPPVPATETYDILGLTREEALNVAFWLGRSTGPDAIAGGAGITFDALTDALGWEDVYQPYDRKTNEQLAKLRAA